MNVSGARESLVSDPDVLDLVEECRLKAKSKLHVEPEYRLGFSILNGYLTAYYLNERKESVQRQLQSVEIQRKVTEHLDGEFKKELEENFADL